MHKVYDVLKSLNHDDNEELHLALKEIMKTNSTESDVLDHRYCIEEYERIHVNLSDKSF